MLQVRNKRTTLDKSLLDFLCFAKLCGTRVFNVEVDITVVVLSRSCFGPVMFKTPKPRQ